MYAEHRYAPRQSRTVSLGAAFLINGALVAGLAFSVPDFVKQKPPTTLPIRDYREPPPPPPEKIKQVPKTDPEISRIPLPTLPDPIIDSPVKNPFEGTKEIYPPVAPLDPPTADPGPPVVVDPPAPPARLILAEQDMRYLKDFQPAYPAAELRAERDGIVKIRVLIGIDGRVKAAEPLSATSDAFADATRRQALAKWRFKPATRGGVPQESWKTMSVRFEIKNQ